MDGYVKAGQIEHACNLFDGMPKRDVVRGERNLLTAALFPLSLSIFAIKMVPLLSTTAFFVILDSLRLKFFSPYLDLAFVSLQLFFSYFKELVGKEVAVELKNDFAIRGTLHFVDQYLNIKLENIKVVDEDKYPHMVLSVVGILQDEVDPMASVMKVEKAPLEFYVDIGGLDAQIQEIKEAVELPLTHPELYEDIGIRPPKELAGFEMEVVKIEYAGHARELASTVEINTYPDGIVCDGGDGIVNEVLNGLLSRDNQKEALSIPIGIIPAGSDNSPVWTILGGRDPISAAMATFAYIYSLDIIYVFLQFTNLKYSRVEIDEFYLPETRIESSSRFPRLSEMTQRASGRGKLNRGTVAPRSVTFEMKLSSRFDFPVFIHFPDYVFRLASQEETFHCCLVLQTEELQFQ
ncbi:hypothetical protein ZIOFF_021931 [Zingiber officinale]|uniref:DAGKc domain-containing protein n=1 Tax=Zingiber officinale TaxID=94328 RepID=A0A8J5H0U8_ZINOF|nr:hypothetical protein ZIOFF_021931 [Zingiber officinale]